jgi:ankyrin repeat protein
MLLQFGANINSRASNGRTPLMWAAFRGNIILLELLLTKGAERDAEDNEGLNCFDIAVIRMQYEAAHYLYKYHGMTRTAE